MPTSKHRLLQAGTLIHEAEMGIMSAIVLGDALARIESGTDTSETLIVSAGLAKGKLHEAIKELDAFARDVQKEARLKRELNDQ